MDAVLRPFVWETTMVNLIYAEAEKIDFCNALEAKVKAFKDELNHCVKHNLIPLIMEIDSLIIKKILDKI